MPEYIKTPYAPDQRTMLDLLRLASADRSRADREKAAVRAQGVMNIGQLIAGTLASIREDRERKAAMEAASLRQQQEDAFKLRDQQIREADVLARIGDRKDAAAARAATAAEKAKADAYKRGTEVAEQVGYGPMSEMQMEDVLQGPAAGRARYHFGPGTAEGPELQPTREQQEHIGLIERLKGMGYEVGPNGQVVGPPNKSKSLQRETAIVNGKPSFVNFDPSTGQYTDLQGNPVTPTPVPPRTGSDGPRPLTQTAEAQIIQRLNTQWGAANKPIKELERQVALMDTGMEAVNRGDLAQGAQMVLVTFQKILDPPSVVRESEFMRSAAGQSLMNRVRGAYERLTKGGSGVTVQELQKFADLARQAATAQRKAANLDGTRRRIGGIAARYGIPEELIFEIEEALPPPPQNPPALPPQTPPPTNQSPYLSTDPNFGTPVTTVRPRGGR